MERPTVVILPTSTFSPKHLVRIVAGAGCNINVSLGCRMGCCASYYVTDDEDD